MINRSLVSAFLFALMPLSAFATNGSALIGTSSKTRALGGTGIAYYAPDSALKNPAQIVGAKGFDFTFAGTYFAPDVSAKSALSGSTSQDSDADVFLIPSIGFNTKITDQLYFALGAFGTGGQGVDYKSSKTSDNLSRIRTSISYMKFAPSLAWDGGDWSIGGAVNVLYGTASIAFNGASDAESTSAADYQGGGSSDDIGVGFSLGASYTFMDMLTVAGFYQSAIDQSYDKVMTGILADFLVSSVTTDELETPTEWGIGFAWDWNNWMFTFDYKNIDWEGSANWSKFGWESQDVFALGIEYVWGAHTFRTGYSMADSPLQTNALTGSAGSTDGNGSESIHFLNTVGFPAIVENHLTFGYGHQFSERFGLDSALVFALEEDATGNQSDGAGGKSTVTSTHSQTSFSIGGNWSF
jgi:long-chain fatty acid transport protein